MNKKFSPPFGEVVSYAKDLDDPGRIVLHFDSPFGAHSKSVPRDPSRAYDMLFTACHDVSLFLHACYVYGMCRRRLGWRADRPYQWGACFTPSWFGSPLGAGDAQRVYDALGFAFGRDIARMHKKYGGFDQ